jgi:UDP-N-acetylglucosamine 1-carboxyvinyltransferase
MDYLEIEGGHKLSGEVTISGAKNAALAIIAATLLSDKDVILKNVPNVVDIRTLLKLLKMLGAEVEYDGYEARINCANINSTKAIYEIVSQMRASILVLGPLLTRFRECSVSLPGGCAIGQRPIDLHLKAIEAMGAESSLEEGYVVAKAPNGLKGAKIIFDKVTVGGSENALMAAAMADGVTEIVNAAREPEVVQLAQMIDIGGAKVEGVGTSKMRVHGTGGRPLEFKEPIEIIPDRIEAGTYLCMGAITYSSITLNRVNIEHIQATIDKLEDMGCSFEFNGDSITINPAKQLQGVHIVTAEYPAFPTDMQAQFMAVATLANEESLIEERLFENRFMHASELNRLGANILINGRVATVKPVEELKGTSVMATDLRASSALVIAGLAAKGITKINRIYHLDRGYDKLEEKLLTLGAKIVRKKG